METDVKKNSSQDVEKTHSAPIFIPPVDIYEEKEILMVMADMPGVGENGVSVNFDKGILTIKGNVEAKAREGFRRMYGEYGEGNYERSFSVPAEIDVEKIEGVMKNGVLTVRLPRAQKPEARKIPIKVE